jgi:hypothetical protein
VTVQPGGAACILVAKYRCDLGELRDATTIRLTLPGTVSVLADPLPPDGGVSALPYCRGGADDPGQTVTVSSIEPAPCQHPGRHHARRTANQITHRSPVFRTVPLAGVKIAAQARRNLLPSGGFALKGLKLPTHSEPLRKGKCQ